MTQNEDYFLYKQQLWNLSPKCVPTGLTQNRVRVAACQLTIFEQQIAMSTRNRKRQQCCY